MDYNKDALDKFKAIYADNPDIGKDRGKSTEADTRANVLDRLVHEVLGWPRSSVKREPYADPGFIDYTFVHGRPVMLMEAKREGITFELPYQKRSAKTLKISGSLTTDNEISNAINQVQKYCSDSGATYGVVTNGFSFIIFRAIVIGRPWKKENAVIFRDYNDVIDRFTEFWNIMSYEAVSSGTIDASFIKSRGHLKTYYRPIDNFVSADATYGRNKFNNALKPYVDKFFGDIASQDAIEILKECYVYSRPAQVIDEALEIVIRDEVPDFAGHAESLNADEHNQGGKIGNRLEKAISIRERNSDVVVLMGGIGSGKSTFCKRFFRVVAPALVQDGGPALLVNLDFIGAPEDPSQLEDHLWSEVYNGLKRADNFLFSKEGLHAVLASEISIITSLFDSSSDAETRVNDLILEKIKNYRQFSELAIRYCSTDYRMPIVLFDNVDQLRHEAQVQLFTAAQRFAKTYGCLSVLVLREESFNAALMKRHLTAATIKPYHLASPVFNDLIRLRIDFAVHAANSSDWRPDAEDTEDKSYFEVAKILGLVRRSLLGRNKNIIRLVESVAYGNMRLALDLFNQFITSGATDMSKIVEIIEIEGEYTVPFHEFIKSVMLGDYKYYKDSRSLILNVFHATSSRSSSHFTCLRILSYLAQRDGGSGEFTSLQELLGDLADFFGNEIDLKETLLRLIAVDRQLVELNTRRPETLDGADSIRITASGQYYLYYLVNSFTYCDLVWQDTPIEQKGVADDLTRRLETSSLNARFERTEIFLSYLEQEERSELDQLGTATHIPPYLGPFMPRILRHYRDEQRLIRRKMAR